MADMSTLCVEQQLPLSSAQASAVSSSYLRPRTPQADLQDLATTPLLELQLQPSAADQPQLQPQPQPQELPAQVPVPLPPFSKTPQLGSGHNKQHASAFASKPSRGGAARNRTPSSSSSDSGHSGPGPSQHSQSSGPLVDSGSGVGANGAGAQGTEWNAAQTPKSRSARRSPHRRPRRRSRGASAASRGGGSGVGAAGPGTGNGATAGTTAHYTPSDKSDLSHTASRPNTNHFELPSGRSQSQFSPAPMSIPPPQFQFGEQRFEQFQLPLDTRFSQSELEQRMPPSLVFPPPPHANMNMNAGCSGAFSDASVEYQSVGELGLGPVLGPSADDQFAQSGGYVAAHAFAASPPAGLGVWVPNVQQANGMGMSAPTRTLPRNTSGHFVVASGAGASGFGNCTLSRARAPLQSSSQSQSQQPTFYSPAPVAGLENYMGGVPSGYVGPLVDAFGGEVNPMVQSIQSVTYAPNQSPNPNQSSALSDGLNPNLNPSQFSVQNQSSAHEPYVHPMLRFQSQSQSQNANAGGFVGNCAYASTSGASQLQQAGFASFFSNNLQPFAASHAPPLAIPLPYPNTSQSQPPPLPRRQLPQSDQILFQLTDSSLGVALPCMR